mmetsp:Transcript_1267/g.3064  ORF Transcript_1267/g.3064 Transcript_1267/m.3064 type:complete len:231 (+) Transcript_1267:4119-4811(+)
MLQSRPGRRRVPYPSSRGRSSWPAVYFRIDERASWIVGNPTQWLLPVEAADDAPAEPRDGRCEWWGERRGERHGPAQGLVGSAEGGPSDNKEPCGRTQQQGDDADREGRSCCELHPLDQFWQSRNSLERIPGAEQYRCGRRATNRFRTGRGCVAARDDCDEQVPGVVVGAEECVLPIEKLHVPSQQSGANEEASCLLVEGAATGRRAVSVAMRGESKRDPVKNSRLLLVS